MTRSNRLAPVQNDRIQFASMRPPGSRFAALERRIQVVGPPDAAQLAESGDPALLDELVPLLSIRDRAWAAEVMLSALTGVEADLVADYTGKPDAWIDGLGATAPTRWKPHRDVRPLAARRVAPRGAVWKGKKVSPTEVLYSYGSPSEALEIVKDFTIVPRGLSRAHDHHGDGPP